MDSAGLPHGSVVKNLHAKAGDTGLTPGSGRSQEEETATHSSIVQLLSCVWLSNPMGCRMPGFPVLHYLLEFAQTRLGILAGESQRQRSLAGYSPWGQKESDMTEWQSLHVLTQPPSSSMLLGLSSALSDPQILPHQKGVWVCVRSSSVQSLSRVWRFATPWTVLQLGLSIFFNWNIADLQCCADLCCTVKWLSYTYIYIFPQQGLLISNFVQLKSPPREEDENKTWPPPPGIMPRLTSPQC